MAACYVKPSEKGSRSKGGASGSSFPGLGYRGTAAYSYGRTMSSKHAVSDAWYLGHDLSDKVHLSGPSMCLVPVLADPDIEAITLATPHSLHSEQIIAAAESGQHVSSG